MPYAKYLVDNHFTAHCEMIFAVINLQFAVISLQFAVIDLQNFDLLWNDLQPKYFWRTVWYILKLAHCNILVETNETKARIILRRRGSFGRVKGRDPRHVFIQTAKVDSFERGESER